MRTQLNYFVFAISYFIRRGNNIHFTAALLRQINEALQLNDYNNFIRFNTKKLLYVGRKVLISCLIQFY